MISAVAALTIALVSHGAIPSHQDQDSRDRTPKIYNDSAQMSRATEIISALQSSNASSASLLSELVRICGFDVVDGKGEILQPAITTPKVEIGIDAALIEMVASQFSQGGQVSLASFATVFEPGLTSLGIKESPNALLDEWISTAGYSKLTAERVTNQVLRYLSICRRQQLTPDLNGNEPTLDSIQILLLGSAFGEDLAAYGRKDELFASTNSAVWRPRSKLFFVPKESTQTNPNQLPPDLGKIYEKIAAHMITLAQFNCKFSVAPGALPLIRTITTVAGETKTITGTVSYDVLRALAGVEKAGIGASLGAIRPSPGSVQGNLGNLKVKWDTSKLSKAILNATSPTTTVTSASGAANIKLTGTAQKKNLNPKFILSHDLEREVTLETKISFSQHLQPKLGLAPSSQLARVLSKVEWEKKWTYPVLARNRFENDASAIVIFELDSTINISNHEQKVIEGTTVKITYDADGLNTLSFGDDNPMFTLATGQYDCRIKSSRYEEGDISDCDADIVETTNETEGESNAKFGDGYNDSQVFIEIDLKKKVMKATLMAPYTGKIQITSNSRSKSKKPDPPKISKGTFANPFWGYDKNTGAQGAEFVMPYTTEAKSTPTMKGTVYRAEVDRLPSRSPKATGFAKLKVFLFVPKPS